MAIVCEKHGVLKRSCHMCDLENEVKELQDKLVKVHTMLLVAKEAYGSNDDFVVNLKINEAIVTIEQES